MTITEMDMSMDDGCTQ